MPSTGEVILVPGIYQIEVKEHDYDTSFVASTLFKVTVRQ